MADYVLRKDNGDIIECDRCGSPAPTVETDWDDLGRRDRIDPDRRPHEYMCVFCYETFFGNMLKYDHYSDQKTLAQSICQSLNIILSRIDRKAPTP